MLKRVAPALAAVLALSGAFNLPLPAMAAPKRVFGLGDVQHLAISADLQSLATTGQGGAFLWDVPTASLRQRLALPWAGTALAFSPDGRSLVVASANTLAAWDTATGLVRQEYAGHSGEIGRLRFSPDGQFLLSASADNTARVWSAATGRQIHVVRTPGSPIMDLALSPDGRQLATVDTFLTNAVKIWDLATESVIRALPKTNWTADRCLFTPAGQLLVATSARQVQLWDAEAGTVLRTFEGITNATSFILDLWLPNDNTVAAAVNDGRVFLWNLDTAALLRVVDGEPTVAAAGVPNEHLTLAAGLDYKVRIRQLPGGDTLRTFAGHTTSTYFGVAFSPDGRYVLSGGSEAAVRLWDRPTGLPVREFVGSPDGSAAVAFSPDGSRVLTTASQPSPAARLWNTETGELEREFTWAAGWPMSAVFSPDGTKIAARLRGQAIRIFDVATGAVVRNLPDPSYTAPIAFAPHSPLLAYASRVYDVDICNYETGQVLRTFSEDAGPVSVVAFSPNGDTLLVGWQDGILRLYDTRSWELRPVALALTAFLEDAAFSPDGQYLVTGDGWPTFTATLWDAATGERVRTFPDHRWVVGAVAFSADGRSLLTGADTLREWSITDLAARLRTETSPQQLRLSWSVGELQSAPEAHGPWQTLTNAVSPWTISTTNAAHFYRVHVPGTEEAPASRPLR